MRVILIVSFGVVVLLNWAFAASAFAYIDPNTGGFFFQTVAPFVYGLLGVIVVFWKKIAGFFKGLLGSKENKNSSSKGD
jgi:CBS domain containing-hemolysin-like protein